MNRTTRVIAVLLAAVALAVGGMSAPSSATPAAEHVSHVQLNHMTYHRDARGVYATETVALPAGALAPNTAPGGSITNSQTIGQLRAQFLGWYLNPSSASGWGGATIEHFPYLGNGHYGISMSYRYDNLSTIATAGPTTPDGIGDCILHPLTIGGHCWNEPGTWDWHSIFGQKGIYGYSAWDYIAECKASTVKSLTIQLGAPLVARGLIWAGAAVNTSLLELNPYSMVIGVVGSCLMSFHKP